MSAWILFAHYMISPSKIGHSSKEYVFELQADWQGKVTIYTCSEMAKKQATITVPNNFCLCFFLSFHCEMLKTADSCEYTEHESYIARWLGWQKQHRSECKVKQLPSSLGWDDRSNTGVCAKKKIEDCKLLSNHKLLEDEEGIWKCCSDYKSYF